MDKEEMELYKPHRGLTEIAPVLEALAGREAYICGGYARYVCSPNISPSPAGDLDIYSANEETFKDLEQEFGSSDYGIVEPMRSSQSLTFRASQFGRFAFAPDIQLIRPRKTSSRITTGAFEEIVSNFDFSVCRIGLLRDKKGRLMGLGDPDFYRDETLKKITIVNVQNPITTLYRMFKYMQKGYRVSPNEAVKIFSDWGERSSQYHAKVREITEKYSNGLKEDDLYVILTLLDMD